MRQTFSYYCSPCLNLNFFDLLKPYAASTFIQSKTCPIWNQMVLVHRPHAISNWKSYLDLSAIHIDN